MKLKFSLHYRTEWGQSLHVVVSAFSGKRRIALRNLPMQTTDGELWQLETSLLEWRLRTIDSLEYYYQVEDSKGCLLRREWCEVPRRYAFDGNADYLFPDSWRDVPDVIPFYSQLYYVSQGITASTGLRPERIVLYRKTIVFRVSAPQLREGEALAVCGSHPSLGHWNPAHFVKMQSIGEHDWMLSLNAGMMFFPLEYKYVVIDAQSNTLLRWEMGDNRSTDGLKMSDGEVLVLYGGMLHEPGPQWRIFGVRTSRPTREFILWAAQQGIRLIDAGTERPLTLKSFRHCSELATFARSHKVSLMGTVKVDLRRDFSLSRVKARLRALEQIFDIVSLDIRFPDDAELHPDYTACLLRERLELIVSQSHMLVALGHKPYADFLKPVLGRMHVLPVQLHSEPQNEAWEFARLKEYPYLSIAATSLPSTPTLRQWWREDPGRAQRYRVTMLHSKEHAPRELTPSLAEAIIARHAFSPSVICLVPMDDIEAMYEGKRGEQPLGDTELQHAVNLNEKIQALIRESHRA